MLIRPAIDDTDPIRYRRPTPDGQFSGNIIDEAMRPSSASNFCKPNDNFGLKGQAAAELTTAVRVTESELHRGAQTQGNPRLNEARKNEARKNAVGAAGLRRNRPAITRRPSAPMRRL
jgi:hypothetical protein